MQFVPYDEQAQPAAPQASGGKPTLVPYDATTPAAMQAPQPATPLQIPAGEPQLGRKTGAALDLPEPIKKLLGVQLVSPEDVAALRARMDNPKTATDQALRAAGLMARWPIQGATGTVMLGADAIAGMTGAPKPSASFKKYLDANAPVPTGVGENVADIVGSAVTGGRFDPVINGVANAARGINPANLKTANDTAKETQAAIKSFIKANPKGPSVAVNANAPLTPTQNLASMGLSGLLGGAAGSLKGVPVIGSLAGQALKPLSDKAVKAAATSEIPKDVAKAAAKMLSSTEINKALMSELAQGLYGIAP